MDGSDRRKTNDRGIWPCSAFWDRVYPCGFRKELRETLKIGWSLVLTSFAEMAMQPLVVMVAGQMGDVELAATALSNSIINVFGTSIAMGLATGCQTVFAQVYGGNNRKELGMHLQRSMCIFLLALCPCYVIHLNIHNILLVFHQDPKVASMVADYLLYFSPGLFFMFVGIVLTNFLQCQNRVFSQMVIGLSSLAVQVCLQLFFVYVLDMGIIGSAIGQSITYIVLFIFTLVYAYKSDMYEQTWSGIDVRCLNKWGPFSKLAIAGMLMMCVEWWAFELGVFLAGMFGTVELAAQSVTFNIDALFYCLPLGLGGATSLRVGHFLGAGEAIKAKSSGRVGMSIVACTSCVVATLFIVLKDYLPLMFSNDMDVVQLVSSLMPIVAAYTFFDGTAMVCRLILRATGQQVIGLIVVLFTYYLLALPLGISLLFTTSLKLKGLWIGYSVALIVCGFIFTIYIIFFTDWSKLAFEAQARARTENIGDDPPLTESGEAYLQLKGTDELSYGTYDGEPMPDDSSYSESDHISSRVVIKRVATAVICVGMLGLGVILRICLPIPEHAIASTQPT